MATANQLAAQEVIEIIPMVMRRLGSELRQSGHLSGDAHYPLLFVLSEGPHNLSELARKHQVSLPTMSNSISRLVDRGLVQRRQSEEDRRQIVIELTVEGQHLLALIKKQVEAHIAEILKATPETELRKMLTGLAVLRAAFESPRDIY